ncbi:hypothetical protein Ddye_015899 [Dipteronia dyeriana]|uniref:Uncharacterized protein n=1 Tax=Dipteronia dyeriana TaxID=168575 RepID=A0AAD9U5P3_9ROSI|nr:hypothetical protein Ddye_015899 [Dipteronia dyeriana]
MTTTTVKPWEEKPHPQVTFMIGDTDSEDNDSRSKTTKKKKIDEGFCAFLMHCFYARKSLKEKRFLHGLGVGDGGAGGEDHDHLVW